MLIGRDVERRTVDQLVAGARIGNSGVLVVTGDAGMGKSALLDFARSRLDGFKVLAAVGTEPERDIPFAGLLSLLRPTLDRLDTIPGPQADALASALALTDGAGGDRFAIGAATLSLLCRHAEDGPVAVVVDDLQLIDRPSAEALAFAARRLSADPVLLIVGARSGECDDVITGLPTLVMTGLEADESRALARTSALGPLTDEQLLRLHEVTGGNPLAVVELAGEPEALDRTAPGVPPPVSATVTASYARRLLRLDPPTRSALLVAVVTGGDLPLVSSCCAELDLDPAALAAAEGAGLVVVAGGQITFRHPLLRAAVYAGAGAEQRRRVHQSVARVLPARDTDRRAWHLSESSWGPDPEVAAMLAGVAGHAVSRTAYSVASTAWERAARLSPDELDRAVRLLHAAETAWVGGLGPRAATLLDELAESQVPPEAALAALRLRATIAVSTGSLVEGRDMFERAAAQATTPDTRIALLAEAVHATLWLGDARAARRLVTTLSRTVEEVTTTSGRALGLIATGMARVLTGGGGADEIRAAAPLLAEGPDLRADPALLRWLMLAPLFLRDADRSGGVLRGVVDEVRSRVGVGTLPSLLVLIARDEATTGAWRRAEANYAEAIRLAREIGQSMELAIALAGSAWLSSGRGQEEACRAHAAEAMDLCLDRGIHMGGAWALFALGDLELGLGDPVAALTHLDRLEALLGELGIADPDLSPAPERVDALLRLGRADEASRAAAVHVRAADDKGQPWACARSRRAQGLVAPVAALDEPFRSALELHARTLDSFETSRTRLAYGGRLRRAGRRVDARPQLRQAMEAFADLGADRWAELAAGELTATGERVPHREPTGMEALTPQELQVCLLLVEGRTTREAAAALFLSPKTVEYHLRKVYTKLGIHSRAELAALLPH